MNLEKIAAIIAIIGIFIILMIGETAEIPKLQIKDINQDLLNKEIKVIATTTKIKNTPNVLIADIQDSTGEITMVAYKEEKIYLEKQEKIEVIGKVIDYKGRLEIQALQIRLI